MPVVRAVASVSVSLPEPPVMVSTLPSVAVLVALARIRASLPAPRSTLPLANAVARVTVSLPVPPISVLTLLTVPELPPAASVSLLLPAPRSTCMAVVSAEARVTVSLPEPPVMVSTLATVVVLAKLPKVSDIVAGAEIDTGVGGGGGEVDRVVASAADNGLGVGDGR